jgi:hypothetical protein
MSNTEFSLDLTQVKAKQLEQSAEPVSAFFCKKDNSDLISKNMSETKAYLEKHEPVFMKALVSLNDNKKLTTDTFHTLLSAVIKQKVFK